MLVAGTQWDRLGINPWGSAGELWCQHVPWKATESGRTHQGDAHPRSCFEQKWRHIFGPRMACDWVSSLVVTMVPAPTGRSHSIVSAAPGEWRLTPILRMGSLEVQ